MIPPDVLVASLLPFEGYPFISREDRAVAKNRERFQLYAIDRRASTAAIIAQRPRKDPASRWQQRRPGGNPPS